MTTKEKALLTKFLATKVQSESDLVHNGCHPITPLHLVDTIISVKDAVSYSNYDCGNLDRILTYLIKYWMEHDVPPGEDIPTGLAEYLKRYEDRS